MENEANINDLNLIESTGDDYNNNGIIPWQINMKKKQKY